jgi:hypothetical protein
MPTCGSTAPLGDGPGPPLELVTALARISGPALALTPREHLLIMLRGDHARPLPLKPALRHLLRHPRRRCACLLLLLRRRRHRSARRRASTPRMVYATMAGPEPSTRSVALAPTAPTAAFVCARRRASTPRMVYATTAGPEPRTRSVALAPTAPTAALECFQRRPRRRRRRRPRRRRRRRPRRRRRRRPRRLCPRHLCARLVAHASRKYPVVLVNVWTTSNCTLTMVHSFLTEISLVAVHQPHFFCWRVNISLLCPGLDSLVAHIVFLAVRLP